MKKTTYTAPDGFQTDSDTIECMIRSCGLGATKYGFRPLLQAIGVCLENPEYLENKKTLYHAVMEQIPECNRSLVTPERLKANMRTSINFMWRERQHIRRGKVCACPLTIPEFLGQAIQALKSTDDTTARKDIIWRYKKSDVSDL